MAREKQAKGPKGYPSQGAPEAHPDTSDFVESTLEDTLHSSDWMAQYQQLYLQTAVGLGAAMVAGLSELQGARTASQFISAESVLANQLLETSATELFALGQQLLDLQLLLNGQLVKLAEAPGK
jgi:hypothetical protein